MCEGSSPGCTEYMCLGHTCKLHAHTHKVTLRQYSTLDTIDITLPWQAGTHEWWILYLSGKEQRRVSATTPKRWRPSSEWHRVLRGSLLLQRMLRASTHAGSTWRWENNSTDHTSPTFLIPDTLGAFLTLNYANKWTRLFEKVNAACQPARTFTNCLC